MVFIIGYIVSLQDGGIWWHMIIISNQTYFLAYFTGVIYIIWEYNDDNYFQEPFSPCLLNQGC